MATPARISRLMSIDIEWDQATRKICCPETVRLSKARGEEVEWVTDNDDYTIRFDDGSPFRCGVFHIPANGAKSSGKPRADCKVGDYKYTVTASKHPKQPLDPAIRIDP